MFARVPAMHARVCLLLQRRCAAPQLSGSSDVARGRLLVFLSGDSRAAAPAAAAEAAAAAAAAEAMR